MAEITAQAGQTALAELEQIEQERTQMSAWIDGDEPGRVRGRDCARRRRYGHQIGRLADRAGQPCPGSPACTPPDCPERLRFQRLNGCTGRPGVFPGCSLGLQRRRSAACKRTAQPLPDVPICASMPAAPLVSGALPDGECGGVAIVSCKRR